MQKTEVNALVEYDKDAIVQPYITDYIRNTLKERTGIFKELEEYARENDVPIVQPETSKFIETLCMIQKPKKILEVGCAIGYSAIVMANASPEAIITTIEFDEKIACVARENVKKAGLSDRINVIYADARDYIPYLDTDEEYDLIFLDGPKAHYINMLDDSMRLLKTGGILMCDNILYKGMTADDSHIIKRKITIVKRLRKLLSELTERDDMETSILTIGDGVTISIKKY